MKIAIMQPYFFPYIGYFQLAKAVDAFVLLDDVQFVKRSWMNRNYIFRKGCSHRITLNVTGASSNRRINEIGVGDNREKIKETVRHAYHETPFFGSVYPIIEDVLSNNESNLAAFLGYGIERVCKYLDVNPTWYWSSGIISGRDLKGEARILKICRELGASHYVNLPGGKALYDASHFKESAVELSFIKTNMPRYKQVHNEFVPNLSIIDSLMFNSRKKCQELLDEYSLV